MEKLPMCRICLLEDVRMYVVVNKNLHELYEKLTDVPFVTEDRRPMLACFFCCTKLKQCWRFWSKCMEAEELFAQMLNEDYEANPLINPGHLEFFNGFSNSKMELISIVDGGPKESEAIKEELPDVSERLDDIIEPEEELHTNSAPIATKPKLDLRRPNTRAAIAAEQKKNENDRKLSCVSKIVKKAQDHTSNRTTKFKEPFKTKHGASGSINNTAARLVQIRDKKEVGQFALPDAPPCKKRRKVSPVRVACHLLPGTPQVPPSHVPQPWEVTALDASGPTREDLGGEDDAASPPPLGVNPLVFTPSTGVITADDLAPDSVVSDASVELLGFSPSTSFSAERFTLQASSPGPSSSSARPDPSIYEDNLEENAQQWEHSVGHYPGSDVEDDDDCLDFIGPRRRHAGEFAVEDLSGELGEVLESMDRQDDVALRESCQVDLLTFDWSHDPEVFTGVRESFTGPAGPTFSTEGMSPFQIFAKIWDEDIINLVVDETNKYAALLLANPALPQGSRLRRWVPITPQELFTFFGVIMLQSIVPIPVEQEYWTPSLPYLKFATFADVMPFRRFSLIKRCLHFVDNMLCARGIPNKLTKIQPIIDHLNSKFSSLYLPEQNIAIDESLMLWKGRLTFSQLIATKAAQVGIKSYELCESRTGYLWQMIICTGKKDQDHNIEASTNMDEPEAATSKIVLKLVRSLLNKGHTLVMDNFYNSPLLARTLKAQKTDIMGTLRLNREFVPDSLRHKNKANMRPGEVAFSQTRDMTITVWKDSNVVSLISTYHKVEVGGKDKYGYYKYKPKVVLDYNLSMGGVDKKDQLLQAFPIERVRNPIWYKKLFRRLLNVSIHNAFVMYAKGKMAQRQFRVMLADEIVKRFRPPAIETPILRVPHFPGKNNKKRARCKWCAMQKVDSSTVYKCVACNVNLCVVGCFGDYHISQGLL